MNYQQRLRINQQQGFTLLELLVVLMIIALLAGFVGPKLFSNVDQAKEKNRVTPDARLCGCINAISAGYRQLSFRV